MEQAQDMRMSSAASDPYIYVPPDHGTWPGKQPCYVSFLSCCHGISADLRLAARESGQATDLMMQQADLHII